jgi:hypothetical protein
LDKDARANAHACSADPRGALPGLALAYAIDVADPRLRAAACFGRDSDSSELLSAAVAGATGAGLLTQDDDVVEAWFEKAAGAEPGFALERKNLWDALAGGDGCLGEVLSVAGVARGGPADTPQRGGGGLPAVLLGDRVLSLAGQVGGCSAAVRVPLTACSPSPASRPGTCSRSRPWRPCARPTAG